jgi:NADPH:quinone reductase-like Zn-dependent oxidoreductase
MRAITFRQPGEPAAVLALEEMPEPTPQAGEVVVAVEARPINPADLFFIRGRYRLRPQSPQIAGRTMAKPCRSYVFSTKRQALVDRPPQHTSS